MVQSGYVEVKSVPTRVISAGGWLQDAFVKQKELVMIITGNPGLTAYYEDFVDLLHKGVNKPVWAVCHAGHEFEHQIPSPDEHPDLYDLEGQIEHKVEFIKRYVPSDVKIHLIGHSVGCYIILKMLKHKRITHNVHMHYLLFPAIERIGVSPNGKFFTFINNYVYSLMMLLASFLTFMPSSISRFLVGFWFRLDGTNQKNVTATMQLLRPPILRNIFSLAADEMEKIQELDVETVKAHKDRLRFYFGAIDGWCPLEYYHNLKQQVPDVDATACTNNYRHAFVLNFSQPMAEIISKWIIMDENHK